MTILLVGMICLVSFCAVAAAISIALYMVDRRTVKGWRERAWVAFITAVVLYLVWCMMHPPSDIAKYMR